MTGPGLAVSVVFATHNRASRLAELLESLRAQSLPAERFEVIAVDDGSTDSTPEVLARACAQEGMSMRALRIDPGRGPAAARNLGWRAARAPLVAFTDDDCVASPGWLEAYVEAAARHPAALLQGRTEPRSDELDQDGPLSRTLRVRSLGPDYQTCNVLYPRTLLETVDGFDEETFTGPGGEDSDLAWRAFESGAVSAFVDQAVIRHSVVRLGVRGKLRLAWRWSETTRIYSRHPALRAGLIKGVFWKGTHYLLFKALIGLALPGRLRLLRWWLAYPYLAHLARRGQVDGGGPGLAPFWVAYDLVEMAAMVRGSVRYRTLVL